MALGRWNGMWQVVSHICLPVFLATLILWPAQTLLIGEGRDIRQDYLGALRFLRGEDPYAPFTQSELQSIGVDPDLGMPRNSHPPAGLVVFAPFALLGFPLSVRISSSVSLVAFFASIGIIKQQLVTKVHPLLAVLAAVWYPPWLHMRFGHALRLCCFCLL